MEMDNEEVTMRQRFEELAPWHVNGTLSESDRRWVEDYLRAHPNAAGQLDWYASLQEKIKADAPQVSADIGLDRLLDRVHLEKQRQRVSARESFLDRLLAPVRGMVASLTLRPVYAYAGAALLVVQAGVIGTLIVDQANTEREFAEYRSIAPVPSPGPVLRVTFKDDARERDIRHALVDIGGTIVAGPGQLGEYIVMVPEAKIGRAAETLRANAVVAEVNIAATPPTRE
jgi:hypothetical protein